MRDEKPDLSLVVPCFDEEEALPALLGALRAWLEDGPAREVVLVDDGSRDRTPALLDAASLAEPRLRVLRHAENRGVGAAMRTGLRGARGRVVACYDADMTYPLADVERLAAAVAGGADVASASPFLPGAGAEGVEPWRVLLSRGAGLAYRLALGRRAGGLRTFTCAFRAYRGDLARRVEFVSDGFPAAAEILARGLLGGARVVEVPSVLSVREAGTSRLRVGRTVAGHLVSLARLVRTTPPRGGPAALEAPDRARAAAGESYRRATVAALNRALPMRLLSGHRNPVVRAVERRRRRVLAHLCAARPGETAVDVGAEEGHLAAHLRRAGARVLRVDLDPRVLRGGEGPAVAADAEALPLRTGAADLVLLSAVLEHVPRPRCAAAEAVRVLGPSGRAVVSVPDDRVVLALKRTARALGLRFLLGPLSPGLAPGHLRVYSPRSLRADLAGAGRVRRLLRDPLSLSIHAVLRPRGAREGAIA